MPSYRIKHLTRYSYASTVIDCVNQIMLYPITDEHLEVKLHNLKISHNPDVEVYTDFFGNKVGVFSVIQPHTELLIESIADIITHPIFFPMDEEPAELQWQVLQNLKTDVAYMDFLQPEMFKSYEEIKTILSRGGKLQ